MGICYAKYSFLATGGGIGNSLFFFASGFTLFLGRHTNFFDYYKRRISRIYPAVIAMAFVGCLIWNNQSNFIQSLTNAWFINCIMVYYILIWGCRELKLNLVYVIIVSTLIGFIVFLYFNDFSNGIIYGNNNLRYFIYFPFMCFGAYLGLHREMLKYRHYHFWLTILSFILWYVFNSFRNELQLVSILMSFPFLFGLYSLGNSPILIKFLSFRSINKIIVFCGGLCLEVYLIQFSLITDKFNNIFPLNIPLIFVIVLTAAYLLHILSKLFLQTFKTEPYSVKEILKV